MSNRVRRGLKTNRKEILTSSEQGGIYMDNSILVDRIAQQLPEMNMAELIQVANYIKGLKAARKFLSST